MHKSLPLVQTVVSDWCSQCFKSIKSPNNIFPPLNSSSTFGSFYNTKLECATYACVHILAHSHINTHYACIVDLCSGAGGRQKFQSHTFFHLPMLLFFHHLRVPVASSSAHFPRDSVSGCFKYRSFISPASTQQLFENISVQCYYDITSKLIHTVGLLTLCTLFPLKTAPVSDLFTAKKGCLSQVLKWTSGNVAFSLQNENKLIKKKKKKAGFTIYFSIIIQNSSKLKKDPSPSRKCQKGRIFFLTD